MSFAVKIVLATVGFAVVLTTSADAAKTRKQRKPMVGPAITVNPHVRGANLFPPGPVMYGTYYLGDDPDPFIRLQLMRDLGAPFGGPD
jgi:hypothetical protein